MTRSLQLPCVIQYFQSLQNDWCNLFEIEDGHKKFQIDNWQSAHGMGEGSTRILENGEVIERGGVNFSYIQGKNLPPSASLPRPELAGGKFHATGISLVMHPHNPYVPTTHANLRFFIADKAWWFGGGFDLTPYYGFDEDCIHWHQTAKKACEPFGEDIYPEFKKWCDDYFYLKHRQEVRGIGGLFFDDLNRWDFETCFDFIKSVGEHFILAYLPLLKRRKNTPYTEAEKQFQLYRRSRYVEFNLIYDRGTLFGLQNRGRTESILMSLPPLVSWRYDWHPLSGTKEAELYEKYLRPREWIKG